MVGHQWVVKQHNSLMKTDLNVTSHLRLKIENNHRSGRIKMVFHTILMGIQF